MHDMIIRAGRQGNGQLIDIAIQDGKIAALGQLPAAAEAKRTLTLAEQVHVSAGWIDGHTHCYPASPIYHDEPDKVGVESGVTTVIDDKVWPQSVAEIECSFGTPPIFF